MLVCLRVALDKALIRRNLHARFPKSLVHIHTSPFNRAISAPGPLHEFRRNPEAWIAALEQYLPRDLRQSNAGLKLPEKNVVGSAGDVLELLQQAREQNNIEVLAHLGIKHQRWPAVHWLVKSLLDRVTALKPLDNSDIITSSFNWIGSSLDNTTESEPLSLCTPSTTTPSRCSSLDLLSGEAAAHLRSSSPIGGTRLRNDTMSQIWQSLGFIVLEAVELDPEQSRATMAHVFQILAHLHHIDLIPSGAYTYNPVTDPSAPCRPPIIHLLSSRILTTMSDAVWKAREAEIAASTGIQSADLSHSIPETRHKLGVRELGGEVWIEFILWCCVDGGFLKEGAGILRKLKRGRQGVNKKWKVVDWPTVERLSLDPDVEAPRVNLKRLRDRADMVVSETEGYSLDRPFVEMGDRTISAEVVIAIVDGLTNTLRSGAGARGNSIGAVLEHLTDMRILLKKVDLKPGFWDRIVVRLVESFGVDPEVDPSVLDKITSFAPVVERQSEGGEEGSSELYGPSEDAIGNSAARLGLLHRLLYTYSSQGNIRKALATFEKCHHGLLNFVLAVNKDFFIGTFANDSPQDSHHGTKPRFLEGAATNVHLPVSLVPALLDLLTETKAHDFGRWLLYSDEVEGGPFIPPSYYSISSLTPALVRFATASADTSLLRAISNASSIPPQGNSLRAFLHSEISQDNWTAVEHLLQHVTGDIGWGISDAMVIASKILSLEKCVRDQELRDPGTTPPKESEYLETAEALLERLLSSEFTAFQSPSMRTNLRSEDMLKQLARIFASIPGTLSNIAARTHSEHLSSLNPAKLPFNHLPSNAFNILLSAVFSTRGLLEAKRLWDLFCHDPQYLLGEKRQQGGIPFLTLSDEMRLRPDRPIFPERAGKREALPSKLVTPNVKTFRTLVRGAVAERRRAGPSPELDALMDWIVVMFGRFFGMEWSGMALNARELDAELDGYVVERNEKWRVGKRAQYAEEREEDLESVRELEEMGSERSLEGLKGHSDEAQEEPARWLHEGETAEDVLEPEKQDQQSRTPPRPVGLEWKE